MVNIPMHVVLAFSSLPLFLGALLSDWAYFTSRQIQWVNFAAWLIAGGLLIVGLALLWSVVDALRSPTRRHRPVLIYMGLLLITFVIGFINALIHAKDGWAAMPIGLILSFVIVVLAAITGVFGLSGSLRRSA